MKTRCLIAGLVLIAAMGALAATNNLTSALQKGLFEEEANRNLDAAISNYQALTTQFDQDRPAAATAIFRLGECYRKLGQTNEAVVQYQRIIREFSDQQTLATLSRQNLTGLGVASQPHFQERLQRIVVKNQQDSATATTDDEDQEVRRIQQMIQNSPDLINAPASDGFTPLGNAARNGQIKVATFLLDHGAGINVAQRRDVTALHGAARAGNRAMVELLLSRGAEVNSKEVTGQTPLHIAADKGFQAVVEVLLANKADVNAQDDSGNTPLHLAAQCGQAKIVKMLLDAGAHPNVENNSGRTPLGFATASGSPDSMKILLAAKADPNGGKLDAPLLCAVHTQNTVAAELLLQAGANPNVKGGMDWQVTIGNIMHGGIDPRARFECTPLYLAISTGQLPMVNLLLKFKADPNDSQTDDRSLLFSALSDTNIFEVLLDAGAKVDVRDKNASMNGVLFNWTLLDAAILEKDIAAVKTLLEHGADPNAHDASGNMALHWAANPLWGQLTDRKLFELLLDHGANPNVRNDDGYTPLDLVKLRLAQNALSNDTTNASAIADLLRQHGALDELPDFTRIRITRQGLSQPVQVFYRASTLTNQFTLLETVMRFYSFSTGKIPGRGNQEAWQALPFPDFGRIIIRRPSQKTGGKEQEIKVSLLNNSNVVDCAKDVPVQFGDVIEIPESVHALNAGMPNPVREMETFTTVQQGNFAERLQALRAESAPNVSPYRTAAQCLQKSVQLVVAGETTSFKVNSWKEGFLSWALGKTEARSVLRSSSDLSRVKVTRKTGKSAKPAVFTVDVSDGSQRNDDLWLQDGDVIEVPEK